MWKEAEKRNSWSDKPEKRTTQNSQQALTGKHSKPAGEKQLKLQELTYILIPRVARGLRQEGVGII